MKLFIINKSKFDQDATIPNFQREIHQKAYNELLRHNVCFDEPPKIINIFYDNIEWKFEFVKSKGDFYIYKYNS